MNWTRRIVIALLLSIAITLGLSALPQLGGGGDGTLRAVFQPKAQALNDQNVVDFIAKLQLRLRVRKVELTNSILSIDLGTNAAAARKEVMQDLYEIPQFMFAQTTNINQVFVRVLDTGSDAGRSGSPLLAALDARRESWMPAKAMPVSVDELSGYVQSHYHVTYTPKWNERFHPAD